MAVFHVYSLYQRGLQAKLNMAKCEGFWLGSLIGMAAHTQWSTFHGFHQKFKVLGVFLGPGNLEEENWRPRITALNS